jgi:ketosteroid isomerase-like protein
VPLLSVISQHMKYKETNARSSVMQGNPLAIARTCFEAHVKKDTVSIEALLRDDFHFTSPIDNALDRTTYLEHCWPNSRYTESFDHIYQVEEGDHAFIVYEARTTSGKRFRNAEIHTVRGGKLMAVEVYFGWDLPHPAPDGEFIENDGEGHA